MTLKNLREQVNELTWDDNTEVGYLIGQHDPAMTPGLTELERFRPIVGMVVSQGKLALLS